MVNPQTPGLQMTHHLKGGGWPVITPSSNLCIPLFSLHSQKGKKTDRGLCREQKQKCLTDTRRNCHPCGFHLVKTNKKRTGTAKKLSLSLPAPLPPLLSLSLYREPGTESLEQAITLENN